MDLINGSSLEELDKRILESNLSDAEKKISLKNQLKAYPNGIEPIGSDAMRLALLLQDFKGDNINLDMNFFLDSKRYCNKIWQSVRYYQSCVPEEIKPKYKLLTINQVNKEILKLNHISNFRFFFKIIQSKKLRLIDEWILIKLYQTVKYVNFNFKDFDLHLNVKKMREFYYANFCDFYLETTKPIFKRNLDQSKDNFELEEIVWNILRNCNYYSLLMYHPIIPSLTEELWKRNSGFGAANFKPDSSILDTPFPNTNEMTELDVTLINMF